MHTTYTGKRLRIRPYKSKEEGFELVRRLHLVPTPAWGPLWFPLQHIAEGWDESGWMDGEALGFAIEDLASGQVAGYVDLNPPGTPRLDAIVSTFILPEFRRQGYGIEAKRLMLCCLFENFAAQRATAITLDNHATARRGLELCGFAYEGSLRGKYFSEGRCADIVFYVLFREQWERMEYRHKVVRGERERRQPCL